jgi:predicted RecB family nuclease
MATRRWIRTYEIPGVNGGDPWPSVTQILEVINKPALGPWYAKMERAAALEAALELLTQPGVALDRNRFATQFEAALKATKAAQKAKEEAAEIGTAVHRLITQEFQAELGLAMAPVTTGLPDAVETCYLHFLEWRRMHRVKPLEMERVVYSRTYRYAGTFDLLADVDGARLVVDLKSSRAIYPEMHLQIAAYRAALAEMGTPSDGGLILRLPKGPMDPGFEAVRVDGPHLFDAFLTALRLFTWWRAAGGI